MQNIIVEDHTLYSTFQVHSHRKRFTYFVLHFFLYMSCVFQTEKILKFSYPNNIKSKLYTVCNSLHTCQARTTLMLLSTTFNNISVITYNGGQFYWWRTPRKPCPVASHWNTLSHNVYTSPWSRFELTTSVVIDTDCRDSCESNYHTITATAAPDPHWKWSEYSNVLEFEMKIWIHVPQHKGTMHTTFDKNNVCPCYIVYIK